jgi:hypothetical protein
LVWVKWVRPLQGYLAPQWNVGGPGQKWSRGFSFSRTRACASLLLSDVSHRMSVCSAKALVLAGTITASAAFFIAFKLSKWSSSMSRAGIVALSFVVALALSSGALAQGGGGAGGGGAGGGGAGGGAGGASSGAAGTTGSNSSGNSVAQPSRGQSGPSDNSAAQSPGSTGQNSINSPGTGVEPGSTGTGMSGPAGQR